MDVGLLTDQDSPTHGFRTSLNKQNSRDHDEFAIRLERLRSFHTTTESLKWSHQESVAKTFDEEILAIPHIKLRVPTAERLRHECHDANVSGAVTKHMAIYESRASDALARYHALQNILQELRDAGKFTSIRL
jgi:hypothetical protein